MLAYNELTLTLRFEMLECSCQVQGFRFRLRVELQMSNCGTRKPIMRKFIEAFARERKLSQSEAAAPKSKRVTRSTSE
jgi:hypothetical protein